MKGDIKKAGKLLGRNVSIFGKVVKGEGRGRRLGFPTANIFPENALLPLPGVYMVELKVRGKKYQGMANVGFRPSFKQVNAAKANVEVHIFKFDENLYGSYIEVIFLKKIRNEKMFATKQQLIRQITKDQKRITSSFSRAAQVE